MSKKMPLNILLVGPSGGGKGTQAKMLAEALKLKHLQSGEILRRWANKKDKFGMKVSEAMQKGFVPSEWIFKIIKEEFKRVDVNQGLVLDSFSRMLPEAEMLYDVLEKSGRSLDYVFFIKISGTEAIKRLEKRGVCSACKEIFMINEARGMKCLKCGGKVEIRKDDNPESIRKRLDDFKSKTTEVINYFRQNGTLIEINGEQPKEKVFEDIMEHIKK